MKHKGLVVLGVLVALVVIVIALIPFLFNANRYRPEIESRLSKSLGRKVTIGDLKLSIFSGGISASNIQIADDPAFSSQPFIQAKALDVGVELSPLIFDKQVKIQSLVLEDPVVRLLQSANGKWNASTIGTTNAQQQQGAKTEKSSGTAASKSSKQPANKSEQGESSGSSATNELSINKLAINNGKLEVGQANGKQEAYTDLNVTATDISPSSSFPFTVSMAAPQGGKLKLDGKAGPMNQEDMSRTPFSGDLTITNLDLAATGFVNPDSGLAGVLDYTGKVNSDGRTVNAEGKATATKLRLVKTGSSAAQPIQVDYHSKYDLARETGTVDQTTIHTGKSAAAINGTYDMHGATTNLDMHMVANQMATGDVEGLLPALGVVLPAGSSLQGGTVSANLTAKGPSDKLVTTGTMDIANTKLAGFSMGKGLSTIAALAGVNTGSDTNIQVLSSNVHVAPEGIQLGNINLVVPELGSMTGSGTIAANSALDFHLVAKLKSANGNPVGLLTSAFGGASKAAANGIPIHITGTTSKPVFVPDVGSAVAGQLAGQLLPSAQGQNNQQNPIGGLLGGLLGNKKKK